MTTEKRDISIDPREREIEIMAIYTSITEFLDEVKPDFLAATALHLALAVTYLVKSRVFHKSAVDKNCKCPLQHDKIIIAIDAAIKALEDISDLVPIFDLRGFAETVKAKLGKENKITLAEHQTIH